MPNLLTDLKNGIVDQAYVKRTKPELYQKNELKEIATYYSMIYAKDPATVVALQNLGVIFLPGEVQLVVENLLRIKPKYAKEVRNMTKDMAMCAASQSLTFLVSLEDLVAMNRVDVLSVALSTKHWKEDPTSMMSEAITCGTQEMARYVIYTVYPTHKLVIESCYTMLRATRHQKMFESLCVQNRIPEAIVYHLLHTELTEGMKSGYGHTLNHRHVAVLSRAISSLNHGMF